jgi:crotonobetainyl-CoA:carnitine CoA-transferase CaiB-like acyl-CoA transferase
MARGMLEPYRVLDLTDVRGQIAGMMLADLGAEVVRIEPPEGSPARRAAPLLDDAPEGLRSLSFAAYNRGKRSVVLDLSDGSSRESFAALVRASDFVLDSGPPSILEEAGFGFERLRELNPRVVHVRVTPFGSDGPRAGQPASDLTVAALGGPVALQGDPDRAPLRLSVPQVWRHAGAEAALAAMVGHARMRTTGEAVFVDVSAQAVMIWTMLNASVAHAIQGEDFERQGSALQIGTGAIQLVHRCADGYIVTLRLGAAFQKIADWLVEDGLIDPSFLDREDWSTWDRRVARGGELSVSREELYEIFERFYARHGKKELFERGLALDVTHAPVQKLADLLVFEQLESRGYFVPHTLPDGRVVKAPGLFARTGGVRVGEPAAALGAHTAETLSAIPGPRPSGEVSGAEKRDLPFAGLKVADFSWVGVGPITAKVLADHGADVVHIESQARPDDLRTAGPFKDGQPGWNRSHFFGDFNASKRSLALDLKHQRAPEIVVRLLGWADVVLESFTPGTAARLGLGYEQASAANPGVIMASTCLLGQSGPFAQMAGYGYHAAAVAGFYDLIGWPDRPPSGPWNAYTDTIAPRFLATTLLAALDRHRREGRGAYIDLAQMEASLHLLAPELLDHQASGMVYGRRGNRASDAAPQGIYPCAGEDRWCAIAVETDVHWTKLRQALGDPGWARDPALATIEGRLERHDEIDRELTAWTSGRSDREVEDILSAAGVPAGCVQRSRDLLLDPQLQHRGFHRVHTHGEMGEVPYSGHAYRVHGYEHGPRGPAPLLGEHSFEVLTQTLELGEEEAAALIASGAVG